MRPVRLIVAKRGFEIFEMCNDWFSFHSGNLSEILLYTADSNVKMRKE